MIDLAISLGDFSGAVDAAGLQAELVAVGLAPLAVSVAADVRITFARAPAPPQLAQVAAVVAAHVAPDALATARRALRIETARRLADLQDFREAARKTAAQLDTEAAAVDAQIDAAPDEATATAIAEAYTRKR